MVCVGLPLLTHVDILHSRCPCRAYRFLNTRGFKLVYSRVGSRLSACVLAIGATPCNGWGHEVFVVFCERHYFTCWWKICVVWQVCWCSTRSQPAIFIDKILKLDALLRTLKTKHIILHTFFLHIIQQTAGVCCLQEKALFHTTSWVRAEISSRDICYVVTKIRYGDVSKNIYYGGSCWMRRYFAINSEHAERYTVFLWVE